MSETKTENPRDIAHLLATSPANVGRRALAVLRTRTLPLGGLMEGFDAPSASEAAFNAARDLVQLANSYADAVEELRVQYPSIAQKIARGEKRWPGRIYHGPGAEAELHLITAMPIGADTPRAGLKAGRKKRSSPSSVLAYELLNTLIGFRSGKGEGSWHSAAFVRHVCKLPAKVSSDFEAWFKAAFHIAKTLASSGDKLASHVLSHPEFKRRIVAKKMKAQYLDGWKEEIGGMSRVEYEKRVAKIHSEAGAKERIYARNEFKKVCRKVWMPKKPKKA